MKRFFDSRRVTFPVLAAIALSLAVVLPGPASPGGCPPGYHPQGFGESNMGASSETSNSQTGANPYCLNDKHPESVGDIEAERAQQLAMLGGAPPPGAFGRAIAAHNRLLAEGQSRDNAHSWELQGKGPLHAGDEGYTQVNGLGLRDLAGRITSFDYIPSTDGKYPDTALASMSYGGIWMAGPIADDNLNWTSIGDNLPTEIMGAVAYTPAGGGTILALSGDGSYGADSRQGAGLYWTTDTGATWHKGTGIPDDMFGFKLAVDKAHPWIVYAATGGGLFRSTNAGRSWTNALLPTGEAAPGVDCQGKSNMVTACVLANEVTDVAVMAPGGTTNEAGGKVLAAVGWRGGNRVNAEDGTIQSPNNGIYTSPDGTPGSFTKSSAIGFPQQDRIGRIQVGAAIGDLQDHNIIYAIVQDAVLIRRGLPAIDVPDASNDCATASGTVGPLPGLGSHLPCTVPTVLNGIYASPDWGQTWTLMADESELQQPATGSALVGLFQASGYSPGIQSWYNVWIHPDPTLAVHGVPTRLLFGLEEVWENVDINVPQLGHSEFHVIGRYFSGTTCQGLGPLVGSSWPACPGQGTEALETTTTTHPDQHDGIFIPEPDGLRLLVGNDGGAYSQKIGTGLADDFANDKWGDGANQGFNTLLPYDASRAKDGTIWMGLQDNGTAKIADIKSGSRVVQSQRVIEAKGGDGFYTAVDPNNGNIAYGEYVGGTIAATSDGGMTWNETAPPITHALFSNPFVMDPRNAKHLMTAGKEVVETTAGPGTSSTDWKKVYDLGTNADPGGSTPESPTNPANNMTALDLNGANAYVGFCGPCDVLNQAVPFQNGLATNVSTGRSKAKIGSSDGWHIARAAHLPNRYITGVAMNPEDPKEVYVALGGYYRPWTLPNVFGHSNQKAGRGHLFFSRDAGNTFEDITANLPDTPINAIAIRGSQIIAATDVGVYISNPDVSCIRMASSACGYFQVLGRNLPMVPIRDVKLSGGDPNVVVAAAYGRGAYIYRFGSSPVFHKKTIVWPKPVGAAIAGPYGFDTANDLQGWSVQAGQLNTWRQQPPGSNASPLSMQVSPYEENGQSSDSTSLVSPKFVLPKASTVTVTWDERVDTEPGFDFMYLAYSSDGTSWAQAYGDSGQNPAFPNFNTVSAQFGAPKGPLYLKFVFASDPLVAFPPYTGVAVDNISLSR
ncbi:MAG: WD40/YVTN/BNR-like repeat-containing protein [Actinomycetota bacterium]